MTLKVGVVGATVQKNIGNSARIASAAGRLPLLFTTWPSVSSVSRSSPQRTVKL